MKALERVSRDARRSDDAEPGGPKKGDGFLAISRHVRKGREASSRQRKDGLQSAGLDVRRDHRNDAQSKIDFSGDGRLERGTCALVRDIGNLDLVAVLDGFE